MAATFGSGRGRLGKATRAWAAVPRPDSAAVLVELAKDAADLADAARSERNGAVYLRAAERLQSLIERVERSSGDRGPGAGDAGDDGGAGELADELGAGPEVGDAAVS